MGGGSGGGGGGETALVLGGCDLRGECQVCISARKSESTDWH